MQHPRTLFSGLPLAMARPAFRRALSKEAGSLAAPDIRPTEMKR
jgi:hypothetical protein